MSIIKAISSVVREWKESVAEGWKGEGPIFAMGNAAVGCAIAPVGYVYVCPGDKQTGNPCGAISSFRVLQPPAALCPKCGQTFDITATIRELVHEERLRLYNPPTEEKKTDLLAEPLRPDELKWAWAQFPQSPGSRDVPNAKLGDGAKTVFDQRDSHQAFGELHARLVHEWTGGSEVAYEQSDPGVKADDKDDIFPYEPSDGSSKGPLGGPRGDGWV